MRRFSYWVALALGFAACELPRPEGAYNELDPMVTDASLVGNMRSDAGMTGAPPPPVPGGTGVQSGMQGGGMVGGVAGGMTGGGEGGTAGGTTMGGGTGGTLDAGTTPLTPEEMALKSLEGRYLMRMDMLSTTTVQQGLIRLVTSNRVSHLLATQLYVENGQLKAYERLCYQTFQHRCDMNCNSLTTTMAAEMTNLFTKMDYTPRSYALANGMLSGMSNTMALGFDAKTDARLPTVEDARVWDPVPGNTRREGLLLGLSLSALKNVNCDVYTTQLFVSKLGATKLAGSATAPSLEGIQFKLDTTGSDGATLGSNQADCKDDGTGAPPVEGEQYVRFARVGATEFGGEQGTAFWNCPEQSVWDNNAKLRPPAP